MVWQNSCACKRFLILETWLILTNTATKKSLDFMSSLQQNDNSFITNSIWEVNTLTTGDNVALTWIYFMCLCSNKKCGLCISFYLVGWKTRYLIYKHLCMYGWMSYLVSVDGVFLLQLALPQCLIFLLKLLQLFGWNLKTIPTLLILLFYCKLAVCLIKSQSIPVFCD